MSGREGASGFEMSFTHPGRTRSSEALVNPHRLIVPAYLLLLTVFVVAAGSWFMDARAEYRQLKLTESARQQTLAEARKRLAEQERILERLRTDPAFVEKVIRKRLSFAKPGEVIFRFED
jgi:cell division protein DivIC